MIRIIIDTTYGYRNGDIVEPKTKNSEPFTIDPEREAELVEMGVAEYVNEAATEGDDNEDNTEDEKDDNVKSVGGNDNIVNNTEDDNKSETKVVDDVEVTLEFLNGMKLDQLKEFAEPFGVEYKVGMKKSDYAQLVFDAIEVEDEATTEGEVDGETPPPFNPEDAVV